MAQETFFTSEEQRDKGEILKNVSIISHFKQFSIKLSIVLETNAFHFFQKFSKYFLYP